MSIAYYGLSSQLQKIVAHNKIQKNSPSFLNQQRKVANKNFSAQMLGG